MQKYNNEFLGRRTHKDKYKEKQGNNKLKL